MRLQDLEDRPQRQTWRVAEGQATRRVYHLARRDLDALPSEGDALPGADDALLGPFVARGGVQYRQPRGREGQDLVLQAITLEPHTPGASGDYVEIRGRRRTRDNRRTTYRTRGVTQDLAADAVPVRGDRLAHTDEPVAPVCVGVEIDDDQLTYPGRYLVQAVYEAPALAGG